VSIEIRGAHIIAARPPFRFRVRIHSCAHHLFQVQLQVPENDQEHTLLCMPNWLPGSYKIRDFSRNLMDFCAQTDDGPCPWHKLDKHQWRVHNHGKAFSVDYLIYAFDLSVRGAHLDESHAYFNGPALFLRPGPEGERPYEVEIAPSPHDWQLLTTLPTIETDNRGFGRYRAETYAHLIDHPVEIGLPEVSLFTVRGIPHRLAISGPHFADLKAISHSLKAICTCHCDLFGELPVADQYLFLLQLVGQGYGGLEHQNSTSLISARADLENSDPTRPGEKYRQFLALCSHEYFHLWNGKRIRPLAYLEPDLSREIHSQLLWLVEGVTSYYDELALARSGVVPPEDYLEMLAKTLTRYFRGKGRLRQALAESSFDAWTKFYQQDENAPNAIVSYYTKGGIVVMMIDLMLRRESDGEVSFDDVMRYLWTNFGKTGTGIPEDAMAGLIEAATGIDLSEPLFDWVHSTHPIDDILQDLLTDVGIGFTLRSPRSQQDNGGLRAETEVDPSPPAPPWLGVGHRPHPLGVELTQVHEESVAAAAALAAGDVLLAIGGFRVEPAGLDGLLARLANRTSVSVHLFRGDQLLERQLQLAAGTPHVAELRLLPDADERQRQNRSAWLHQG
jgi:predicted metalloprotease with PDZ domain